MANTGELFWIPLMLVGFALAGGAYGSLFVIGRIVRSRLLLGIGWVFFALQSAAGLGLLASRFLGAGGKLFVGASLLAFALFPSLAWNRWARSEPRGDRPVNASGRYAGARREGR